MEDDCKARLGDVMEMEGRKRETKEEGKQRYFYRGWRCCAPRSDHALVAALANQRALP